MSLFKSVPASAVFILAGCNGYQIADKAPNHQDNAFVPVASPTTEQDYKPLQPMPAAGPVSTRARRILVENERGEDSDISYLGRAVTGTDFYSVYRLDFVNPQSRHGTIIIGLIRNDREFAGSYAISGHASATEAEIAKIEGGTLIFACDQPGQEQEKMAIGINGPPARMNICGGPVTLMKSGM